MSDGRSISSHYVSKTNGFDSHAHGVEPGQILASEPVVHKGLHQELVTLTEECYIWEGLTDREGVLGSKLPEGFVPTISNIGCKWLVGRVTNSKRDPQFKPDAFSSKPQQLTRLRILDRFLEQGCDVVDFLGEEGVLELISLEQDWAKKYISRKIIDIPSLCRAVVRVGCRIFVQVPSSSWVTAIRYSKVFISEHWRVYMNAFFSHLTVLSWCPKFLDRAVRSLISASSLPSTAM